MLWLTMRNCLLPQEVRRYRRGDALSNVVITGQYNVMVDCEELLPQEVRRYRRGDALSNVVITGFECKPDEKKWFRFLNLRHKHILLYRQIFACSSVLRVAIF